MFLGFLGFPGFIGVLGLIGFIEFVVKGIEDRASVSQHDSNLLFISHFAETSLKVVQCVPRYLVALNQP